MRRWIPFVTSVAFLGMAWLADRRLVASGMETGADAGQTETLVFTSLVALFAFAIVAVALGWLVLRAPRDRAVGLAMLAPGLYVSVVLTLNILLLSRESSILLPLFVDTVEGFLLRWAGTVVTLLGLVMIARPSPFGPIRAWWALVASLAVIGLSYPAGTLLGEAGTDMAEGNYAPGVLVESLVRFASVAALLAIGWLLLRGPRPRVVGGLIAAAGLYIAVVVPLAYAWYFMGNPGDLREPVRIPLGIEPGMFRSVSHPLVAAIVAVLGLAAVSWPTRSVLAGPAPNQHRPGATDVGDAGDDGEHGRDHHRPRPDQPDRRHEVAGG